VPNVVFVAPYLLPTTQRFLQGTLDLPGTNVGLIGHEPSDRLDPLLMSALGGHWRTDNALDPEQLLTACTRMADHLGGIDCLIGPLEELQVPIAQTREALGIPGMGVEAALNFRDKDRMKDVFDRERIPCARHGAVVGSEAARQFARHVGFPVVAKPPAGSGSRNTVRIDDSHQLEEWLRWNPVSPDRPMLLEEFVVGQEHAFDCVFVDGQHRFHSITRYHPAPLDVMQHRWIQWAVVLPRDISGPEFEGIRHHGPAALSALGLQTGLVHMEWFRRADGTIAISEVAARPPGAQFSSLISYAHDIDLYRAWSALMVFGEFEVPERRYAVGAVYLRGQGDGRVVDVHGLDSVQQRVGDLVVEARLPSKGQTSSGHYEGDGYVIVRHEETEVVEEAIDVLLGSVRVEVA